MCKSSTAAGKACRNVNLHVFLAVTVGHNFPTTQNRGEVTVTDMAPIVIGGNGHSGTRVFNEILTRGGVFTGFRHLTKRPESEDLRIIGLLNRWVRPYVYGELTSAQVVEMKNDFTRRLRLYFPFRKRPWGFKNPRTMLILPLLNEMFPDLKFIHVIRDGRDISLGNPFATGNPYVDAFLFDDERRLPAAAKMILFWGRSNEKVHDFGQTHMRGRYLMMRWEDLCDYPDAKSAELLQFASADAANTKSIARIVRRPNSIGRWKTHPGPVRKLVLDHGGHWLKRFQYA